ncbi:hypothetical protein KO317_01395 [Candidatus Micrarchaeota archaeon]|jgi:hypothetical protein|nr:hypothetical protein [Candidatus Micrarchaeota archaeon]
MAITKELVKIGRVLAALLIGSGAGYIWYYNYPTDPIYYSIGIGLFVFGASFLFFKEKNISGGLANNLRTIVFTGFGVFLGYMWYSQFKDIQQSIIVGIICVILLVLLGKKAFKGGEN